MSLNFVQPPPGPDRTGRRATASRQGAQPSLPCNRCGWPHRQSAAVLVNTRKPGRNRQSISYHGSGIGVASGKTVNPAVAWCTEYGHRHSYG
jgi:hypothetical protein